MAAPGSAVTKTALSALSSVALEEAAQGNTGQWSLHIEFPLGAGMSVHTGEQHPEPRPHPPVTQTLPAVPGTALWLGTALGISGLERQQMVIVPGVDMTFPKLTQPLCRRDLT